MKLALLLPFLFIACTGRAASPFDEADNAAMSRDQRRVRDLFVKAAESDPDPQRRDQARLRAARIDWYILHEPAAARAELGKVPAASREASAAHAERSRLECELVHDFDAARKAAQLAYDTAKTEADRNDALTRSAAATLDEARLIRDGGTCPDRTALDATIALLQRAIEGGGPTVERTRMLLDAALLAHHKVAALAAWRWYYSDLPSLVPASLDERTTVAKALASARLFAEADLVLRDPCLTEPVANEPAVQDILAYAASTRRVAALAAEYHRAVGAGTADKKSFTKAIGDEAATLWQALSWPGQKPPFSLEAVQREVAQRFGAVISLGETEGIFNLLYGHRVADETRSVEQYNRRGSLHFVRLDGMISGGYAASVTHGMMGTGGWIGTDAMYQVRPMYVDNPLKLWRQTEDPVERARMDDEVRRETALDRERAKGDAIVALPGLTLRLRQQYADALRKRLESEGLQGNALRDAFLRTATADKLASSIWAHEGRHSIDKALGISNNVELEFRAKLSEVVFAPAPRGSMGSILSPLGGKGAHGEANARVLRGVAGWMHAHANEIAGFDPAAPALTQLDRLTDDQLRAAFRSLDPLAR